MLRQSQPPLVRGMDFPLEVEYAREISQDRRVAYGRCLYMPCSYVSCIHYIVSCHHLDVLSSNLGYAPRTFNVPARDCCEGKNVAN